MKVFDLDRKLVADYEHFSRSFTKIRSKEIRNQVDQIYASGQFWPDPLITINPHFEEGASVADLAVSGLLHSKTADIFAINGSPIKLYRHQEQAVVKAAAETSFVVTTGTGSGKSLCFFVPIIDATIRAREKGEQPRTRAIIVYPMNALANSQMAELQKYIGESNVPEHLRPTFARYTGQESKTEREAISRTKPDILLTNFMMLELLMTRQNELDRTVISNAEGLDFIVLDELHTYRGRQGADVAMLIRRVRDRLCPNKPPICIGTSATMASEGSKERRATAVANVASRLFGAPIEADSVIGESLRRATDKRLKVADIADELVEALAAPCPAVMDDAALKRHPLAIWIELEIGLDEKASLGRRDPVSMSEAAGKLKDQTELSLDRCREQLEAMLTLMSLAEKERGGHHDHAFMAFKLHRFFSGAGRVYTTLKQGDRHVTLDGQLFDPSQPEARLYSTFFCRECGQEFHPVSLVNDKGSWHAHARSIDDTPIDGDDSGEEAGYVMPVPQGDRDYSFSGRPEDFPEDWIEISKSGLQLRSNRRKMTPREMRLDASGGVSPSGHEVLFLPGKFSFCPACGHQPSSHAREINKLAGLSGEGRSSATTLLVSSTLRWMNAAENDIEEDKRKLLGFTDNRQDAALQAGHFNDFVFVTLFRAALLAAVRDAGDHGLRHDEFGRRVQEKLQFVADNRVRRIEWMVAPEVKGVQRLDAERVLTSVLQHRVWSDQRRGWRFTNPNLEELGLIAPDYLSVDELAADEETFANAPSELRQLPPKGRRKALLIVLEALRKGLAVSSEALDPSNLETLARRAEQLLSNPWSLPPSENVRMMATLVIHAPRRAETTLRSEALLIRGGPRSRLAKELNRASLWGERLKPDRYQIVLQAILEAAQEYQLVQSVDTVFDIEGWRLNPNAVRLVPGANREQIERANPYFVGLYDYLAETLAHGGEGLFGLEGREHTAQVEQERRLWRERRFRFEKDDQENLARDRDEMRRSQEPDRFLPTLFCSPTMELGVDISALNTVYLRNIVGCHPELTQQQPKLSLRTDPCATLPLTGFVGGYWSDRHGFFERHSTLGIT